MKVLSLLFLFAAFATAQESDEKQSAPVGKFLDPENIEQIGNIQSGYSAVKESKGAYGHIKSGNFKTMATDLFSRYQNSKAGLFYSIGKFQKKIHGIISKVSQRVDRWRTTVPRLRAYKNRVIRFADDSYTFARTFETSDLWDIDRDFSREMEWRVSQGQALGTSIWDYLSRRVEGEAYLASIQEIFFPDFELTLNQSSIDGFYYVNDHSESEKVPIFAINESFGVMGVVKQITEEEFSGLENGSSQAKQYQDSRLLKEALSDDASSYTDQLQVRQDILNKLYEVNAKRSMLKDRIAYLDLLWGRLEQQKVEARQAPAAAIAAEVAALNKMDLNPDEYVLRRYGLEDVEAP